MKHINKIRNILFQSVWFTIRGLIPRKIGDGSSIRHYAPRMLVQLALAWLFGSPAIVLIGDSNSEVFSKAKVMRRFDNLAVSLGIGGTRLDQWAVFFETTIGRLVLWLIDGADVFINLGGNNVLQRKIEIAQDAAIDLQAHLPYSWIILIPPIYFDVLGPIAAPEVLRKEIKKVNKTLKDIFIHRVIDPSSLVDTDSDGNPDPLTLTDPVHYGNKVVYVIQDKIKTIVRK